MAVYGITKYGTETYGYNVPPAFRVDPFAAVASSYGSITLSWARPVGTIQAYRLIRNQYGYPVDQDDGEILIDSLSYPGSLFIDSNVQSGVYYYYAIYVATNLASFTWVRSGYTACLSIKNFNSYTEMYNLIPNFYVNASNQGDILIEGKGNVELQRFMQIFGWGLDLLRTQYATYLNVNNPWKIPLSDLYNLATELGLNINPDIHPYTLRKAVFNNAIINQQRGTPLGIATEVSSLTGWNIDLQIGPNMMLENDQSGFIDPVYPQWSANISYLVAERVTFGNYKYACILTGNIGHAPSGTSASNTYWQAVLNSNDNTVLLNTATGNPDTWDVLYPSVTNGAALANSIFETVGVANPQAASNFTYNSLQVINNGGSPQNIWARSVARTPADLLTTTTTFATDKYQAIADGIPVPYSLPFQKWNATTTYSTNQIVTYNNQPFIALRQSTGAIPPYSAPATPEWSPIALEPRYRLCVSAYCTGSTAVQVTPFVEWYDAQGNFISREFSRNPTPGSVGMPDSLFFDSFTTNVGGSISGRITDDGGISWTVPTGSFTLSPVNGGSVYPTTQGQRSIALINSGVSDTQLGVTFVSGPQAGQSQAIIFRSNQGATKYLRADWTTLMQNNNGAWSNLGTYSTPFSAGDRMTLQLSGISIIVLRNGVQVLSAGSNFNQTSKFHGIIVENT